VALAAALATLTSALFEEARRLSVLADFRTWIDDRIRDGAGFLTQAQKDSALDEALNVYSRHRPREIVADIAGSGAYTYALPATWEAEFSIIVSFEWPSGDQWPSMIESQRFQIYDSGAGDQLRTLDFTPSTGQTMRIVHTARHAVAGASSTVAKADEIAVAELAASICLRQLAARAADSRDSTILADAVDYGGLVQTYTQLADRLLRAYRDHVGVGKEGESESVMAATAILDVDPTLAWGEQRLFHNRRWF